MRAAPTVISTAKMGVRVNSPTVVKADSPDVTEKHVAVKIQKIHGKYIKYNENTFPLNQIPAHLCMLFRVNSLNEVFCLMWQKDIERSKYIRCSENTFCYKNSVKSVSGAPLHEFGHRCESPEM